MKALSIGGAMIDTIAIVDSAKIERMSMLNADSSFLLLAEGQKTEAVDVSTHCGGGAVNTAIAMARLGLDVAPIVKLGRDARAEMILQRLVAEGVSTRWIERDARATTGASVMIASHDRNAAVFTFRGANTLLEPSDIKAAAFGVDLVYVSNLSNESADCYPLIIELVQANDAFLAVNPGVRQLAARGRTFLDHLASVDVLSINTTEAEQLMPALTAQFGEGGPALASAASEVLPRLARRGLSASGFEMTLVGFMEALLELGVSCPVVTDGKDGAYAAHGDKLFYCPGSPVTVAGTAGAGDAFSSTFSMFLCAGRSLPDALAAGVINAASVVAHIDTQTGLMAKDALEANLAAVRAKVRSWPLAGRSSTVEKRARQRPARNFA